jgi:hypothetical protein
MKAFALGVFLALIPSVAGANCLAQSQSAIAAIQLVNAYTIASYTWQGDPQYDQVMPLCSKTALREIGCNVAFNVGLRVAEDAAFRGASPKLRKTACLLNYLGAIGFGLYIRKAIQVQIFKAKF